MVKLLTNRIVRVNVVMKKTTLARFCANAKMEKLAMIRFAPYFPPNPKDFAVLQPRPVLTPPKQ